MDGWVVEILKQNGVAGVTVFILAMANVAQWGRLAQRDKLVHRLHEERASERETLVKIMETANTAAMVTATATERRNEIMDGLGSAISAQASALERYDDRVKQQAEMLREKFADFRRVVDSFGESNRVNVGALLELRAAVQSMDNTMKQVAIGVASNRRGS